ncbi:YggT family protein [Hyphococcus flavus]|uniref:YggT family protein n=1 Tax=Hyphococcus flavus TaxID=1866326 RepID=A0AAE9ZAV0_9PROT|nr:YggT family protein [Hyphococcus flavus]WDI30466.1 YggT family protein [Hyphococcus flavus]
MIPMPFFSLIDAILQLYTLIVFVMVIMSWLIGFNVINRHNQIVDMIWRTLIALTEPALRPIRRMMPSLGGIDISPLVLLLGVFFLREMNMWLAARYGIS